MRIYNKFIFSNPVLNIKRGEGGSKSNSLNRVIENMLNKKTKKIGG